MSEYQYYEFLALDRPLEQSEIAALMKRLEQAKLIV